MTAEERPDGAEVQVKAVLCDKSGAALPGNGACSLEYRLTPASLTVSGSVSPALAGRAQFVLPLNGDKAEIEIMRGSLCGEPAAFFRAAPGFLGKEYRIAPDAGGRFCLSVRVRE